MRLGYTSMELRHLRYFVMAAEEQNISRAAARLNVSQPAVSRQIRDLEAEWDVELFTREPQGLRLTPAGEVALSSARDVLRRTQELGEALQPFRRTGRPKTLRVGFIPTALPGLLAEGLKHFNRHAPDVCIQITETSPAEQIAALRRGELDLALPGAASAKVKAEFFTTSLRTTPLAMVVPEDHPLAERKSVELREFGRDTFLSLDEARFPGRARMHQRLFGLAKIQPPVSIHASGLNELLSLIGAGAGVALAPADLNRLQSSGVRFLKLTRPTMTFNFAAVWRDSDHRLDVEHLVNLLTTTT
jgi:LysR family transcriptional regulator, benzoate and cis,cis-muconate-responsive activator of ben and cat genes